MCYKFNVSFNQYFTDTPTTPTKGTTSSRTDGSISPPRAIPPKPLPRVTIKKNMFSDNNIEELEYEDNDEYDNDANHDTNVTKKRESSQPIRTSFSGIDPKRLERRMKRPSSAPTKKQADKENVPPDHLNPPDTDSSVDLRKDFIYSIETFFQLYYSLVFLVFLFHVFHYSIIFFYRFVFQKFAAFRFEYTFKSTRSN